MSPVKVAMWSGLGRVPEYCTGVGKHVLNMSCGLGALDGIELRLILSKDLARKEQSRSDSSRMEKFSAIELPFSRRSAEGMWRTIGRPAIDRWARWANWVYCPKELYVPVEAARYAITVHDLYAIEPAHRRQIDRSTYRWRRLLYRALQSAHLILTVSEFTKHRVIDLMGIEEDKIRVVGNGVEDEFYRVLDDPGMFDRDELGSPYVLVVGGITKKKGASSLLAVADVLARSCPDLKIVVIGPVEPAFRGKVAATCNLEVINRGLPNRGMKHLMHRARAVLLFSEYEGFGIPVGEAMAVGTPVVAANRAALPETVGSGGLVIDPYDPEDTSERIRFIVEDSADRRALIARGRKRAEQFRWSGCVARLRDALEEFSDWG